MRRVEQHGADRHRSATADEREGADAVRMPRRALERDERPHAVTDQRSLCDARGL